MHINITEKKKVLLVFYIHQVFIFISFLHERRAMCRNVAPSFSTENVQLSQLARASVNQRSTYPY